MNLAGSGLQSGNLPWLLGQSTVAWNSEFGGGGMGEEEGEERETWRRGPGELGSGPCFAAVSVTLSQVPSFPPVLEVQSFFVHLLECVWDEARSGSVSYL